MTENIKPTETLDELKKDFLSENKLISIGVNDLISYQFKPKEMILSPWLPTQSLNMIYAPRGLGKTHVSLGIAYAVASGGSFLKWTATKPRGVLFLDGEMAGHAIQERLVNVSQSSEKVVTANLLIVTPDLQPMGLPDLGALEGQLMVEELITKDIELIIIDNLSSWIRSGKENEAESWQVMQDWLLRLRARGISVLIIHHSNKAGSQRGTSRREDVLDNVIALKRSKNTSNEKGALFEVHFEKSRHIFGKEVKPFEAELLINEIGKQQWHMRTLEESTYSKVVALFNEGLSQVEIALELNVHESTVSRHVNKAKQNKEVEEKKE